MAKYSPYTILPDKNMFTQADPLKEAKDLKTLVNGDYEREYRVMVDKRGRKRGARVCVIAGFTAVLLWLLALTVVREVQLSRLRSELGELSATVVALTATVNNLHQKVSSNRLFKEFNDLEYTLYTDVDTDESEIPLEDGSPRKENSSVKKLDGLTELESNDDLDDDEEYDGDDDEESGDWYPDYDNRRDNKIGRTNMVKLEPEDFTGAVVTLGDKRGSKSIIREIKRMLNENPEAPDSELAAAAVAAPASSAEKSNNDEVRARRSVFPGAPRELIQPWHSARISEELESPAKLTTHTAGRSARNSDDDGRSKPFVAAHFHGNTSHLSTEIHEHYKGNGLIRVGHDAAHDVWYPSAWTQAASQRPTLTRSGHVRVHHTGVYLVYVQIYYLDAHEVISWVLHRTNAEIEGREPVLQCAQSTHSPDRRDRPNSCFSAAALFLKAGDRLAVRNTAGERHSLMQPEKSFIGLIKLADAEDPEQEFKK